MSTWEIVHNKKFLIRNYQQISLGRLKNMDKFRFPQNFHVEIQICPVNLQINNLHFNNFLKFYRKKL